MTENLHALPISDKPLNERQQSMLEILHGAMKDIRSGRISGLSIVRLLEDGRVITQWAGTSDVAMTTLVGAIFRLATEMASAAIDAPDDGGSAAS